MSLFGGDKLGGGRENIFRANSPMHLGATAGQPLGCGICHLVGTIRPFYKARAPVRLTQERPKCALHHGKMLTNKCRARYEITHEHVSNDLKMWIKRLHTEIHIIITIYIHHKSIYFKIITCIILGLVNSNVFACKTNGAFNDFVDSCVTGKHNRTGARAL